MAGHDQLFKDLLRAFFGDFLHFILPNVAETVDCSSPIFLDKEFFTDLPTGRRRTLDLLARVASLASGETPLLVHIEIEARATRAMGARLRHYSHQIEARHQCRVLSVVVNLRRGQPGLRYRTVLREHRGPAFSEFRYLAWGLAGAGALAALDSSRPLAWACAALMQAPLSRAQLKLACLKRIAAADLTDVQRLLLVNCVETYLQLNQEEARELAALSTFPESREVEIMAMTWADRLIAKGREEGRVRTLREILVDLLVQRFGPLPSETRGRIEAIESPRRLTQLTKRVLAVHSLAEMKLG